MKKNCVRLAVTAMMGAALVCFAGESEPKKTTIEPGKVLVAYYSWSGNTRYMAKRIQAITGGTLFEITPKTPYPTDYRKCVAQARKEIKSHFKPELAARVDDIGKYDVIFVGSPNWCGTMAPPVATFLTTHDLKGKTVIPFFTHGRGGMQNCEKDVRKLCTKSVVLKAAAFPGATIRQADDKIEKWATSVIGLSREKSQK